MIDMGANIGLPTTDFDNHPRPLGKGYDIGVDEYYHPALQVTKQASPTSVQDGASLAYLIRVTNTGNVTLTATVIDILPEHVTPTGVLTWMPPIIVPGGIWTQQVVVTVQTGYSGALINVVEVKTQEGATGRTSAIVCANICKTFLPVILKN